MASRASVNEPSLLSLRPSVQSEFGFAEITTLAFEDVYAGKLMAALDRQHPRDLFDVMILLENEGAQMWPSARSRQVMFPIAYR